MAGKKVYIKFNFPPWMQRMKSGILDIQLFIAAMMQTNRGMLFDQSGAYNGHDAWDPLVLRAGQPLKARGDLARSIGPTNDGKRPVLREGGIVRFSGHSITIGTSLAYARLMNDGTTKMPGGVLKAVNAKALKIPLPSGKKATATAKSLRKGATKIDNQKFIFRKSVKIPARPFDQWNKQDEAELNTALRNKIASVLNGDK